jgi:hypothetical protein
LNTGSKIHPISKICFLYSFHKKEQTASVKNNISACLYFIIKILQNYPAWEFQAGDLCRIIDGTFCHGMVLSSAPWHLGINLCKLIPIFPEKIFVTFFPVR